MERGRSYARRGQVAQLEVQPGLVRARVQGSRPRPYVVTLRIRTLSRAGWVRLAQALSGQAVHAARLLAGEMPRDIEQVFQAAGLELFPASTGDLQTECSCPDWENPCKHIAAVHYLLGEEIDRDPFLLLRLRGMQRQELLDLIGPAAPDPGGGVPQEPPVPVALPPDPGRFWGEPPAADPGLCAEPAGAPAALLQRLGGFPWWRGQRPLAETLARHYANAPDLGLAVLLGEGLARAVPGRRRGRAS
jgi:uncharacterized Zn finger protein